MGHLAHLANHLPAVDRGQCWHKAMRPDTLGLCTSTAVRTLLRIDCKVEGAGVPCLNHRASSCALPHSAPPDESSVPRAGRTADHEPLKNKEDSGRRSHIEGESNLAKYLAGAGEGAAQTLLACVSHWRMWSDVTDILLSVASNYIILEPKTGTRQSQRCAKVRIHLRTTCLPVLSHLAIYTY